MVIGISWLFFDTVKGYYVFNGVFFVVFVILCKYHIGETLNLLTCADISTNINKFSKKEEKLF